MHSAFHTRIKLLIADLVNPKNEEINLINGFTFSMKKNKHYIVVRMRAFHQVNTWRRQSEPKGTVTDEAIKKKVRSTLEHIQNVKFRCPVAHYI